MISCDFKPVYSEFWMHQTKIDEVLKFEKAIKENFEILEQKVLLSPSVFPKVEEMDIEFPFIVKREGGFLPLYAEYYFTKDDSIIQYISYNWEHERFGSYQAVSALWNKEKFKLSQYDSAYEKIKEYLISELLIPKKEDKELVKRLYGGNTEYFSKETLWENEDFESKLTLLFGNQTFRIRWVYYWK